LYDTSITGETVHRLPPPTSHPPPPPPSWPHPPSSPPCLDVLPLLRFRFDSPITFFSPLLGSFPLVFLSFCQFFFPQFFFCLDFPLIVPLLHCVLPLQCPRRFPRPLPQTSALFPLLAFFFLSGSQLGTVCGPLVT